MQGDITIGFVLLGLMLLAGVAIYLLPTIVAENRKHPNKQGIMLLNLLLGWTLIGWVVALVWSVSAFVRVAEVEPNESQLAADTRPCPYCAEPIRKEAIKCRWCKSDLVEPEA